VVEPLVLVALGTAGAGIALWFVTNLHIRWTKRALQAYGEDARHRTEAFVARELQTLESSYVQHTKSLTERVSALQAGIPEAGSDRLEAIDTRLDGLIADLKGRFDNLPAELEFRMKQASGRESIQMGIAAKELNEELKTGLAAVQAQVSPEALLQGGDIRAKILQAISKEPSLKQRKDMGMLGELIWNAGRAGLANWLQGAQAPGGQSVTYTVTQPGDKNFKMEM